ncbi:MAG: hypothetical protein P8164_05325 [Gammaproteobacteria bacterium]|jgi:hypothetical protein
MGYFIDKRVLRSALALCLLAGVPLAHAGFGPAATARDWCKKKTLHFLKSRGYIPYNWEATTDIEGNNYVTKGVWRIDVDDLRVQCSSNKHARKPSGKYKILNVEILDDGKATKH